MLNKGNKILYDRVILEVGCGPNSLIGRFPGNNSKGCRVVRITEAEDVCSARGLSLALAAIADSAKHCSGNLLVWVSLPCTGGCPWQRMEAEHGEQRQG